MKKSNLQKRNLRKTSKFQLKQATRKFSKKTQLHKKQAQIWGETARLATLIVCEVNSIMQVNTI